MPLRYRVSAGMDKLSNFDVDLSKLGNLTPEDVGRVANQVKELRNQKQYAKAVKNHYKQLVQLVSEIENIRLEAIKLGLTAEKEIQKYILEAIKEDEKFKSFMTLLGVKKDQELNFISRVTEKKKEGLIANFKRKLDLMFLREGGKERVAVANFNQRKASLERDIEKKSNPARLSSIYAERERIKSVMRGEGLSGGSSSGRNTVQQFDRKRGWLDVFSFGR